MGTVGQVTAAFAAVTAALALAGCTNGGGSLGAEPVSYASAAQDIRRGRRTSSSVRFPAGRLTSLRA
jgi:hypothetical protein